MMLLFADLGNKGGSVLKSFIKALVIVASLALTDMACAVGFGGANVVSALGQPLNAEISLIEVGAADKSSLKAHLASPDAFKAAGLEYPYHLSKLKFDIDSRNGESYIKVTSKEAVNDPVVTLLVELNWSSGRLVREYTFLLDPPNYQPEQPKTETVTPIEPVVAAVPPVESPQVEPLPASAPVATEQSQASEQPQQVSETAIPESEAASAPVAVESEAASAPVAAESEAASAPAAAAPAPVAATTPASAEKHPAVETITVKRGDTLTRIATQIKEPDVTLEQMLVALYRTNANKFDGKNMNRIRAGKILKVPGPEDLEHLSQTQAVKEIRIQTANWNSYKQKLAAASMTAPEQAPRQEVSGKISTSVADKTPAVKQSANGTLTLSKGEAPGDKTVAGGKAQTQAEKVAQAREEAIAKQKAAQEANTRTAMLEKNNQDLKKLIELKGGVPVPASAAAAASSAAAASAAKPAVPAIKPQAKPKFAPVAVAPEPSLLDQLLDNPMYLGGAAAILLGLGGLGFYLVRRGSGGGRSSKKKSLISQFWKKK